MENGACTCREVVRMDKNLVVSGISCNFADELPEGFPLYNISKYYKGGT